MTYLQQSPLELLMKREFPSGLAGSTGLYAGLVEWTVNEFDGLDSDFLHALVAH
jgi:hypothetical protein